MKLPLLLITLLLIANQLVGQDYDIKWSEINRKKGSLIYILPSVEGEFYALRWTGGRLLGHYQVSHHKNLKLTGTGNIPLIAKNSIANFEGARVIGGKFVVFLSDKSEGFNHFYMQPYGDDLKPKGEPIHLAKYELEKGRGKGWFDVEMSSNREFFAVVWEIPGKKDQRHKYGFKIFNKEMKEHNEGEYPLPFDARYSKIHSHHISNTGDYFLALTEFEDKTETSVFKNDLKFKALHIFHIAEDGLQDFTLDLQGKRVEAMAMTSDTNDIFIITGIYGQMDDSGVSGVFHQRVNLKTQETLAQGFKEFSKEFITQDWDESVMKRVERRRERGKGEPMLYNYQMRQAIIQNDGSIVGTLEQFYIQVSSFTDSRSGQVSSSYYYYYNDIIAYKIGPNGDFEWMDKIRKYQVSTNDGGPYSSYESFLDGNKLCFIFNDNVSNYNEDGTFANPSRLSVANYGRKKNVVAIAEIDLITGEQRRKTLFNRSEVQALAVPKMFEVSYQTGEFYLYTIVGGKEKFGLLNFPR